MHWPHFMQNGIRSARSEMLPSAAFVGIGTGQMAAHVPQALQVSERIVTDPDDDVRADGLAGAISLTPCRGMICRMPRGLGMRILR